MLNIGNNYKTIIGIVVRQIPNYPKYYIWSKEAPVGVDGILIENPTNPVQPGDYVLFSFTDSDYKKHFPENKHEAPRFEAKSYIRMSKLHQTIAVGVTIQVELNLILLENQGVINHDFFGKIYNNRGIQFPSGEHHITIKRVHPGNRDSVWVLEKIEKTSEKLEEIKITGIVACQKNGITYAYCNERPPGKDIIVKTSLPLGTWITATMSKSEFEKDLAEIEEFTVIKEIYKTSITGVNSTLNLELECFIEKMEEISHPFLGMILNDTKTISIPGNYKITVIRAKPRDKSQPIRSVWFLRNAELIEKVTDLENQLRNIANNNEPSTSSRLPRHSPTRSTEGNHSVIPSTPIAAPRRNLETRSPAPETIYTERAIVINIIDHSKYESIYVWLMAAHRDGELRLSYPAEKMEISTGTTLSAEFKKEGGKMISKGPVSNISHDPNGYRKETNDVYFTRKNDQRSIDVKVCSEGLKTTRYQCSTIYHPHFGYIIDNCNQLRNHEKVAYHMWIRRVMLNNERRWVVVEQIQS